MQEGRQPRFTMGEVSPVLNDLLQKLFGALQPPRLAGERVRHALRHTRHHLRRCRGPPARPHQSLPCHRCSRPDLLMRAEPVAVCVQHVLAAPGRPAEDDTMQHHFSHIAVVHGWSLLTPGAKLTGLAAQIAPVAQVCLQQLAALLLEVCKNPMQPTFNHYLFESVQLSYDTPPPETPHR